MKYNVDEVIGMAWSDKISFEEIKKKNRTYGKGSYFHNEKKFKKKKLCYLEKKSKGPYFKT